MRLQKHQVVLFFLLASLVICVYFTRFHAAGFLPSSLEQTDKFSYIEKRFERRLKNIREFCKDLSSSINVPKTERAAGFYTVPKKHLLMCEVPKAGTSTWNRFFWKVERSLGDVLDVPYDHKYLAAYRDSAWKWIEKDEDVIFQDDDEQIEGYFKRMGNQSYHRAIMARHPFGRLISGWNDKYSIGHFQNEYFMSINGLKDYITEKPKTNHTISWPDFARFVAEKGPRFNVHFQWNYFICQTCQYNFNYVVKLETLDEDKEWLAMKWRVSNFTIGHENVASSKNKELNHKSHAEKIESMMNLLPQDVVDKLYKIFEPDFLSLGYTFENMTAGGFD